MVVEGRQEVVWLPDSGPLRLELTPPPCFLRRSPVSRVPHKAAGTREGVNVPFQGPDLQPLGTDTHGPLLH